MSFIIYVTQSVSMVWYIHILLWTFLSNLLYHKYAFWVSLLFKLGLLIYLILLRPSTNSSRGKQWGFRTQECWLFNHWLWRPHACLWYFITLLIVDRTNWGSQNSLSNLLKQIRNPYKKFLFLSSINFWRNKVVALIKFQ